MTNFKTVKQSVRRLKESEAMFSDGTAERLSKKERLSMTREMEKLESSLGGIKNMERLPDALFVVDVGHEKIAVAEARKLGIPIVGVVDSNNSPEGVDYIVPGNDDSIRAIQVYVHAVAQAIQDGKMAGTVSKSEDDEFIEVSDAEGESKEIDAESASEAPSEEKAAE